MFDLHMHTTHSDGKLSTEELMALLGEEGVNFFSITDHNHCLAYEHFDALSHSMIAGVEIATSFQGYVIELLGYGVDTNAINAWFRQFFSEEELKRKEMFLFHRLKKIVLKNGFILSEDLTMSSFEKGISKKTIYQDLILHNPVFLQEFPTYRLFFRGALSNPKHDYFLNEALTYPPLEEAIGLIRQNGGLVFLAHPYEYGMEDLNELLMWCSNNLDGIECFHPSCSMQQSIKLFDFCSKKNVLASGGSDFHREDRKIRPGVRVSDLFYDQAPFAWLHKFISKELFR